MSKTYDRHSIGLGNKIKITQIRSGTDMKGLPYWKFYVPFTMRVNGNPVVYKHLWCRVMGRPIAQEGDWVQITRMTAYHPTCRRDDNGGMTVFEDMIVEVGKVVKERDYENE